MLTRPLDPKDRLDIELTADPHAGALVGSWTQSVRYF